MSAFIKGVFKGVREEILYLADAALKSGTANISQQLVNVYENRDENQPSSSQFRTLVTALKSGILDTGQDIMTLGLERVKTISPPVQKQKVSE
jgi:hypothetical protein